MSNDSPAAILFNRDGYDVVITDGYTIVPEQSGIIMAGRNGSIAKFITLDGYGQIIVVGTGIAGSPSGGVVTIQGVVGGQTIPVSGNFSNSSVSLVSTTPPGSATYIGGSVATFPSTYTTGQMDALSLTTTGLLRVDGSNVTQPVSGTVTVVQPTASNLHALVVGAASSGFPPVGAPVLIAGFDGTNVQNIRTFTDGTVRIDPTGTTTQPVSQVGTWSVSQVTSPWITRDTIADGYLQNILTNQTSGTQHTIVDGYVQTNPNIFVTNFPSTIGVTQVTSPWVSNITQFGGNNIVTGTGISGLGIPRVTVSNDSNILATQSGTWTVQQGTPLWTIIGTSSDNTTNSTAKLTVLPAIAKSSTSSWTDGYQVPLTTLLTGALRTDNTSWFGSIAPTVGQKTMANSIPIVISSDQTVIPVSDNSGSLTIDNSTLSVISGGTEATALRVTIANDSTGVLSVDDNGGSLTIDGTVTSNQGAAVALSGKWPVQVTDGTNTMPTGDTVGRAIFQKITDSTNTAAVKAASTAAIPADSALVVAVSPNNIISVTTPSGGFGGQVEGRAADGVITVGNPVLIGGSDGINVQTVLTDTLGRIIVAPASSSSTVSGFADGHITLASTTVTAVYNTTYTEQTSNAQRSIVSSSASDSSAGVGARTIKVTYYTSALVGPNTEIITLNGTTAVNTTNTNICFIEKIEVLTVGSSLTNVGTINLHATTAGGGVTIWSIAIGEDKTFGAHHYVTTGKTCYITAFFCGIKGADTTSFILKSKDPTSTISVANQISDTLRVPPSAQSYRNYGTPIAVVSPAKILAFAAPDSTSSRTYYASFDFYDQ